MAELDQLSERVEHEARRVTPFGVLWLTGWVVFIGGCVTAGGLLTQELSGEITPGLIVGAVVGSALVVPVFRVVMALLLKFLPGDANVGSVERLWLQSGLASSKGVTMKATEAIAKIAAPGTTSGVSVPAKRA
ncbi:hypothetical protein GCM10011519_29930 [Marmoricola endophyticus]|uniref:Uncharacterized protein n=1 Tax=Marmoricola endophyticus TaxID=2040280 RepID=A0A917BPK4_9ACTN|nr:hypothetical protein GCM10011519_29930 [Marmoricola endophyticus]